MSEQRTEHEIEQFCQQVARESFKSMNGAYHDWLSENAPDDSRGLPFEDCDVYLYVYCDGRWTIDGSQYLQDHRNIVAAVPVSEYSTVESLASEINLSYEE